MEEYYKIMLIVLIIIPFSFICVKVDKIYNKLCEMSKVTTREVTFWIVNPKNSLAEVFSGTFEQWSTMEIEDKSSAGEFGTYFSRQKTIPCGIIIEKTSGHVFKVPPEQITFIK